MNKFSSVNRVIFDLDNTLIQHNYDEECAIVAKYLELEGNEEFKKEFNNMFKNNSKYLKNTKVTKDYFIYVIEKLMPILKLSGKTGEDLLNVMDKYLIGTLMEGAKEILEYLYDSGYQIVILTNWFYDYQVNILKRLGIYKYFERVYAWDDYYAKPHSFAILRALENTDVVNNVMIGDDLISDIELAKKCNICSIGFNINYSKCKNNVMADANVLKLIDIKKYL